MPDSFAMSGGQLYVTNGIDPVLVWDGFSNEFEQAGIIAPAATPVIAGSGAGSLTGTYAAFVRFVDRRGNYSNLSPISLVVDVLDNAQIDYSNLAVSTESKVVRRQILRNTDGQGLVYYVDIDTEDLTSTTLSSTRDDTSLAGSDFQALLDENSRDLSLINGRPPDTKSIVAAHLDRLFLAGETEYRQGCVAVTAGSLFVQGIGTEWPVNFEGRFLWVDSGDIAYEIDSVDVATQVITLLEPWAGSTDAYITYAIRPALPERRSIAFSEAGYPESWSPLNAVSLQEDGDEITGLMVKDSFLYILERRHIYRLTMQNGPNEDGGVFLSVGRGCINNRCWVVADEQSYLLDQSGCYSFDGAETESISDPIQDLFSYTAINLRRDRYRINWASASWFHACYDRSLQVIRWFVTLGGSGIPKHALCYDLRQKRWWIEEYPFPVGSSCVGRLAGLDRVVFGGLGTVYSSGSLFLDLVDPSKGTVRGAVASATQLSLTASNPSFGADVVGAALAIVAGRGRGQVRRVTSASGAVLQVDLPWQILPDDTSVYQLGAIGFKYRTGWFRWSYAEQENERRLEIVFDPLVRDTTLDASLYLDRSGTPVVWQTTYSDTASNGFSSEEGHSELVADLTKESGFVQRRLGGHKELYIDGPRFVSLGLEGFANAEEVRLISITIDGAESK